VAERCPCGRGATLDACCGPIVAGTKDAPTAEALMRSRYTAFALGDVEHLRRSWHPSTCPRRIHLGERTWVGLDVLATTGGGLLDQRGTVEFVAHHHDADGRHALHEDSEFVRVDGRWTYLAPVT
jgi:SEC-C motif-containing protein